MRRPKMLRPASELDPLAAVDGPLFDSAVLKHRAAKLAGAREEHVIRVLAAHDRACAEAWLDWLCSPGPGEQVRRWIERAPEAGANPGGARVWWDLRGHPTVDGIRQAIRWGLREYRTVNPTEPVAEPDAGLRTTLMRLYPEIYDRFEAGEFATLRDAGIEAGIVDR